MGQGMGDVWGSYGAAMGHGAPRQLEAVQLLQRPAGALRLCKLQWGGQLWGDVGQGMGLMWG